MTGAVSLLGAAEKNSIASNVPWLVLLEVNIKNFSGGIVATIYVAHNNEDVLYNSNLYVAYPFDIKVKVEAGGVPTVTLEAVDFENVLTQYMNLYEGLTGSSVTIRVINSGAMTADPELEEEFTVVSSSEKDFKISLQLGAENALQLGFPRMTQMRNRCRWRYRGVECAYAGALPTCDLSLDGANGCTAHDNEIRFGGFPGLVSRGIRIG